MLSLSIRQEETAVEKPASLGRDQISDLQSIRSSPEGCHLHPHPSFVRLLQSIVIFSRLNTGRESEKERERTTPACFGSLDLMASILSNWIK